MRAQKGDSTLNYMPRTKNSLNVISCGITRSERLITDNCLACDKIDLTEVLLFDTSSVFPTPQKIRMIASNLIVLYVVLTSSASSFVWDRQRHILRHNEFTRNVFIYISVTDLVF